MKKSILSLIFLLAGFLVFSQEYRTGLKEIKEGDEASRILNNMPRINIKSASLKVGEEQIRSIDNSKSEYFPDIIDQAGGSCVIASTVGHIYSYELNKRLNRPADFSNRLNYQYIYALCNGGENRGCYVWEPFYSIMSNGVPYESDHYPISIYEWISGANTYINGMSNGIDVFGYIKFFDAEENYIPEKFEEIKQFLVDDGETGKGGLLQFSAFADPLDASDYDGPSTTGYNSIIPEFGTTGMHSMTIVGFDDDVEWDYNKDGEISDDEKGAFVCVNSWGSDWGDNGHFYAPYKTFIELRQGEGGTGNGTVGRGGKACWVVYPKLNNVAAVIKARVKHTSRNDFKFVVGIAANASATEPDAEREVVVMYHAGGDLNMSGGSSNEIELAINVSDLLDSIPSSDSPKFFIDIESVDDVDEFGDPIDRGVFGTGSLKLCSLVKISGKRNEFLGTVINSHIAEGASTRGVIVEKKPDVADGINTEVDYIINDTKLELYINAANAGYILIDVLSATGDVVKTVTSKVVEPGGTVEIIDIAKVPETASAVRVSVDNKLIYKRFK